MEKLVGSKAVLDVVRRTAPLKVAIGLLYRELDAAKSEQEVTIDKALFEAVITSLELVVDDIGKRIKVEDRKVVETQPRIAANRT